jgi:hypothetical protein
VKDFTKLNERFIPTADLQEACVHFRNGDSINNEQLKQLIQLYQTAEGVLTALGVEFHTVRRVIRMDLGKLESFQYHRNLK